MTAIIGILNKSAVAIAADSAVSVGTEINRKVYNYANKIFNLSISNPIAVMIYNNAEYNGIPWETIVKMYRNHSDNKKFDTVTGYRDDFITFLKSIDKYFDKEEEQFTINEITIRALNIVEGDLNETLKERFPEDSWIKLSETKKIELYKEILIAILTDDAKKINEHPYIIGFDEGDKEIVRSKHSERIKEISNQFLTIYLLKDDEELVSLITEFVVSSAVRSFFIESWTGVVFTGFGETELFPSLYSIKVGGIINDKIRYVLDSDSVNISNSMTASITPFAQTDIMRTFVEGIDPFVKMSLPAAFEAALGEFKDYILQKIDYSTKDEEMLKDLLDSTIPDVVQSLVQRLEDLRGDSHINPMLSTISSLSKEDLTEMAESLINLTYLKRRVTFDEESVGGPIDVAVITKGDGFIWIKRKHYFKTELNLNYLAKVTKQNS